MDQLGLLEQFRARFQDISAIDAPACEQYIDLCHSHSTELIKNIVALVAGDDVAKYVQEFLGRRRQMVGVLVQD